MDFIIRNNFNYFYFFNLIIKFLTFISSEIIKLVRKHMKFLKKMQKNSIIKLLKSKLKIKLF